MEVSGQLHTPAALPSGKNPPSPTEQGLGGSHSLYGRGGKEPFANRTPLVQAVA
jgi:hypothetical protein